MKKIPAFVRGMVVKAVEDSCRRNGIDRVTAEELEKIRARMPTPQNLRSGRGKQNGAGRRGPASGANRGGSGGSAESSRRYPPGQIRKRRILQQERPRPRNGRGSRVDPHSCFRCAPWRRCFARNTSPVCAVPSTAARSPSRAAPPRWAIGAPSPPSSVSYAPSTGSCLQSGPSPPSMLMIRIGLPVILGSFSVSLSSASALVALSATMRPPAERRPGLRSVPLGRRRALPATAALQAVDGVALKVMVDRWAQATGEARVRAFEGSLCRAPD